MRFTSSVIPLRLVVTCILFSSPEILFGQEMQSMKEEIQLEGEQLRLVDSALAEFRKNNLDSLGYKLSVYRTESGYVAIFEDANIASGQRGSSPSMPSFEVELNKNHEVVRSNFMR